MGQGFKAEGIEAEKISPFKHTKKIKIEERYHRRIKANPS